MARINGLLVTFLSLVLVQSFCANRAFAEGPSFKDTPTELGTVSAGEVVDIDLRSLLSNPGTPPLKWFSSAQKPLPVWLTLDSGKQRLYGTPSAQHAGTHEFLLSVTDAGEGGDINHLTRITVLAPPVWNFPNTDLGIQSEGNSWAFDLSKVLTNPSGGNLNFTAVNLPSWMALDSSSGILSGTPQRENVGKYQGIQFTASGIGGSATTNAFGEVRKVIKPPHWSNDNIVLADGFEDQNYSQSLLPYVVNPEGAALTYSIVSQTSPEWLNVGQTDGTLFGTPSKIHLGTRSVTVLLSATIEGNLYTDSTTFTVAVVHVNHAPQWLKNPLPLTDGASGIPYSQSLAKSFRDIDDGDTHTYEIVPDSGPSWASLNQTTGVFSGTPTKANVGTGSWLVRVTDQDGLSDVTTLEVTVIKSNEPPQWVNHPTLLPEANEDSHYNQDLSLKTYVSDPDNDVLRFSKLSGPNWVTVTESGQLRGTPAANDVGIHRFQVKVTDNISGSDVTEVQILVLHTNHPPQWVLNPIRFTVDEDANFSRAIGQWATDVDAGDELTFSAISGPPWATLSREGVFSGKPGATEIGANQYVVQVSDNSGLTADVTVIIEVRHVNHKPYWQSNPITLSPNGFEKQNYTQNIAALAKDPDGDTLTFALVEGPSWVKVSQSGEIYGTPQRSDVGTNSIRIRAMDPELEFATTTFLLKVEKVNQCPRWRQSPLLLSDAFEGEAFRFDLTKIAIDDDQDILSFSLVKGPSWLSVNSSGQVTGTPGLDAAGPYTATFAVTDSQCASLQAPATGNIIDRNQPPTIGVIPVFSVKERTTFSEDINKYVTDGDDDALNFVAEGVTPKWFSLSADGKLTVTNPAYADLGVHRISFKVDDGELPARGTLVINILRNPRPPRWTQDPIRMTAKTNQPFSNSLKSFAVDDDGINLSFSKIQGKNWLTIAVNGSLSGTPKDADIGDNIFVVNACNDSLCAEAALIVQVRPGTTIDTMKVDAVVVGARADNIWIIDNSHSAYRLVKALRHNIHIYFQMLHQAGIHHSGIYLSADPHRYDGMPIHGKLPKLIRWDQPDVASEFGRRIDLGLSQGGCGNCYNSPIWSLYRFHERLPNISDIYHQDFIEPQVPMDVMIVTQQQDHYRWYTHKIPEINHWRSDDFADAFTDFHQAEGQPLRISAITPKCPSLYDYSGDPKSVDSRDSYQVLVEKTGGTSYTVNHCDYDIRAYLKDYADKVIFRARLLAKKEIRLSKTPIEISTIKVWVGDQEISSPDQWRYQHQGNLIEINWNEIDQSEIKPGDEIRIEYRVS